jgi:hypothetical protein
MWACYPHQSNKALCRNVGREVLMAFGTNGYTNDVKTGATGAIFPTKWTDEVEKNRDPPIYSCLKSFKP